jgi:hypothetical protein
MSAQVYFSSIRPCSGGGHLDIDVGVNVNGSVRTRTIQTTPEDLRTPITDEDIESFVKVNLRLMRAQAPNRTLTTFRQDVLSKIIDLSV